MNLAPIVEGRFRHNSFSDWDSINGAKETRTPDPLHAMQVLYQLSYGPKNADEV